MRMFEKLHVGTYTKYVTEGELKHAQEVYDRYVRYWDEGGYDKHSMHSLAEFLLEDVDYVRLDSFIWDKGQLVRTSDGKIGITTGWNWVGCGCSKSHFAVKVKTAAGEESYTADKLEKADVPPEVLEYVKSTIQCKVHSKVDEAFGGDGDGRR